MTISQPIQVETGRDRLAAAKALDIDALKDLLGLLLVNGSMRPYSTPSGGYIQLTLVANEKSKPLLDDKIALIRHHVPTFAGITQTSTRRSDGSSLKSFRFRVSTNRLRPLYNLLYPGGEREITRNALEMLGGAAAAWVWAEGARPRTGRHKGETILKHVGSTKYEACLVGGWIELLTGAESTLTETRRPQLLFEEDQCQKIREVLLPYAPPSRQSLFQSP